MSEKTAIEKAREAIMEALAKDAVEGYGMHPGSVQLLTKALAAINAEKQAEENCMVLLDAIFDAITENGIMNHPTKGMFLTSESIDACLPIIQRFAETYHSALAALDAENPAVDAEKLIAEIADECDKLKTAKGYTAFIKNRALSIQQYAESYHAARCKECVGKLPAFPHRDIK